MSVGRFILLFVVATAFAFLLIPIAIIVVTSFSASPVLSFPPRGFTLGWYQAISTEYLDGLRTSLIVGAGTTTVAILVGTPTALGLVRGRIPGRRLIGIFCLSPLMVPTLVLGVAAFQFTLVLWDITGIDLQSTHIGLILGQSAFAIPVVIRTVMAGHAHYDVALEEAAANLGASPSERFFRVTIPMLAPGITSGAIFAFLMSFDDVPLALFLGGGGVVPLPVRIFTAIEYSFESDVMAVASLVVFGSLILMFLVDRIIGLDKFFGVNRA
jgi:putative spermidine/putrescine transport system permease protein